MERSLDLVAVESLSNGSQMLQDHRLSKFPFLEVIQVMQNGEGIDFTFLFTLNLNNFKFVLYICYVL